MQKKNKAVEILKGKNTIKQEDFIGYPTSNPQRTSQNHSISISITYPSTQ